MLIEIWMRELDTMIRRSFKTLSPWERDSFKAEGV
jgi:hypothetical protein